MKSFERSCLERKEIVKGADWMATGCGMIKLEEDHVNHAEKKTWNLVGNN